MRIYCLISFENQHISDLFLFQVTHLLVNEFQLVKVLEIWLILYFFLDLAIDYEELSLHFLFDIVINILANFRRHLGHRHL